MYVKAYAKINVFLDVVGKRKDGYHDLNMIMLPLELHDTIEVEYLPYASTTHVITDRVYKEETKSDLINETLDLVRKTFNAKEHYNITVHKEIPIFAGLGGGSSNAAATLRAFTKYGKIKMTPEEEMAFGLNLGADIPFCLKGVPAHVQGIGDKVEPIEVKKQFYVLIIKPKQGLSTKEVFKECDKMKLPHGDVNKVIEALKEGNEALLASSMMNSLETTSMKMCPEIKAIKEMFLRDGFKCVLMTGSGSCVYALTTSRALATAKYHKYENENYEVILTKTKKA